MTSDTSDQIDPATWESEAVTEKVERKKAQKAQAAKAENVPAKRNAEYVARYHTDDEEDGNDGVGYAGRLLRFNGQSGCYVAEGGEEIPEKTECVAYADFAQDGWIRFGDDKTVP